MNRNEPTHQSSSRVDSSDGTTHPVPQQPPVSQQELLFRRLVVLNGLVTEQCVQDAQSGGSDSLADVLVVNGSISMKARRAIEHLVEERLSQGGDVQEETNGRGEETTSIANLDDQDTVTMPTNPMAAPIRFDRFGDYDILGEIARGGMGVVYRARQRKLDRVVALKMIREGGLADDEQISRFYAEAKAAASLDHPGIVPVFEIGEQNEQHFFSMAFVDGTSLHKLVKDDGPLPAKRAATLAKAIAEAVQSGHDQGIIHRDLKPQNVLLDHADTPRVTDFGLAKLSDSNLTMDGQIMGTPSYMSPEQAMGRLREVGRASDVYSIGATLYYLLTGRAPFHAAIAAETIRQVVDSEPVPPRMLNPSIPRDLETICLKCLRKEISARYATASDLAADLGRWLENKPIRAREITLIQKTWLSCKRRPAIAVAIVAMIVLSTISGAVLFVQHRENERRIAASKWENDRSRALSHVENMMNAPAEGVPFAIKLLEPLAEHTIPLLRERFGSSELSETQRVHAAMALAEFGEVETDFLVHNISNVAVGECSNLLNALTRAKQPALQLLHQISQSRELDRSTKARIAILEVHLGNTTIAEEMCALKHRDPAQRTSFIETLRSWHGPLGKLATVARKTGDPALRSAICLGIGGVQLNEFLAPVQKTWTTLIRDLYKGAPDNATQSAASWVSRQWKLDVPSIPAASVPQVDRAWYVNRHGMVMRRVNAGEFDRESSRTEVRQRVTISRTFYMSDREISVAQFRQFLAVQESDDIATAWKNANRSDPADHHPVQNVKWMEAILFCNWLSMRDGVTPCYEKTGQDWNLLPGRNGYRLPTEAEWEYAARAMTTTLYPFANDDSSLQQYAVFAQGNAERCGIKLPNQFGLFDTLGNAQEWCFDPWTTDFGTDESVTDPINQSAGRERVLRGGSFRKGPIGLQVAGRAYSHTSLRLEDAGFRVVRNVENQ